MRRKTNTYRELDCVRFFAPGRVCPCAWHRLQVFPRFAPTELFPALDNDRMFSRVWQQLDVYPSLTLSTWFPALGTDWLWLRMLPHFAPAVYFWSELIDSVIGVFCDQQTVFSFETCPSIKGRTCHDYLAQRDSAQRKLSLQSLLFHAAAFLDLFQIPILGCSRDQRRTDGRYFRPGTDCVESGRRLELE